MLRLRGAEVERRVSRIIQIQMYAPEKGERKKKKKATIVFNISKFE